MMIYRAIALALCAFATVAPTPSLALDESDIGRYRIVNGQGMVKDFRLTRKESAWAVEAHLPDVQWVDVMCTGECFLRQSAQSDFERFFSANTLAQIVPDCIHNVAFAFCRSSLVEDRAVRDYAFILLTKQEPVVLRLARADVPGSQGTPAPSGKASWEAQITKAKRSGGILQLYISFRYVGTESEVPAPVIKVRDATGAEWPAASETRGGRDKNCVVWLSMSGFIVIGLKPPPLPKEKVDSCQHEVLTYFFGPPRSAKPPFELLFADAPAVIVELK